MNDTSQHEFDDELLSAYLDDELSPAERSAVEARLDADPAAQQLLDQLRAASQAVQRLPQEPLARDLREAVLERIAAKTLPLPLGEGSKSERPTPRVTVGQTRRGWVWAALAVAAALMIMFVQSKDQQNNNLPAVAQHDNANDAKIASDDSMNRRELRDEPMLSAPAPAAPAAAAPAASAGPQLYFDKVAAESATANKPTGETAIDAINGNAQGTPMAQADRAKKEPVEFEAGGRLSGTSGEAGMTRHKTMEKLTELSQSGTRAGGAPRGTKAEAPAESPPPASVAGSLEGAAKDKEPLVVVHVLAKPDAMQKKKFDEVLKSNGVFFDASEPPAAEPAKAEASDRFAQPSRSLSRADDDAQPGSGSTANDVDMVLVEAPAQVIDSCVAKLNEDHDNYFGVDVDESPEADKSAIYKADAPKIVPANKLAADLGKYRRGVVTQQQKELGSDDARYHFLYDRNLGQYGVSVGGGSESAGVTTSGIRPEAVGGQIVEEKQAAIQNVGRAYRLPVGDYSKLKSESQPIAGFGGGKAPEAAMRQRLSQVELKKAAAPGSADNVTVLFHFRSSDAPAPAASSPPADNPSK